jgi:hypothetical protein
MPTESQCEREHIQYHAFGLRQRMSVHLQFRLPE